MRLRAPLRARRAGCAARGGGGCPALLRFYGPSRAKELGAWAGVARGHARRVWAQIADELVEVRVDGGSRWLLATDESALASPPRADDVRLLPPRDPYLQDPDRATLVPDPAVRKRLFRPVGGPGAVLQAGRLVGLWRVRASGKRAEIEVEALERIDRAELEVEADRVARLRGAETAVVTWS